MKKLLAILSVVLFANQASADQVKLEAGDVFYCVQIASFVTDAKSGKDVTEITAFSGQEKLFLKLYDEGLSYKKEGFDESFVRITSRSKTSVTVAHGIKVFTLSVHDKEGKIYFAEATAYKGVATMQTAECDKFP